MSDFILCWPEDSASDWLLSQTAAVASIKAQRAEEAEADYLQYRLARSINVKQETLASFFGEVPAEEMEKRYREEQR